MLVWAILFTFSERLSDRMKQWKKRTMATISSRVKLEKVNILGDLSSNSAAASSVTASQEIFISVMRHRDFSILII